MVKSGTKRTGLSFNDPRRDDGRGGGVGGEETESGGGGARASMEVEANAKPAVMARINECVWILGGGFEIGR